VYSERTSVNRDRCPNRECYASDRAPAGDLLPTPAAARPLFEESADGDLEHAGKSGESDHRGFALGALELDQVQATAADLGGQPILGEPRSSAVASQLAGESREQLGPLVGVAGAPGPGPRQHHARRIVVPSGRSSGARRLLHRRLIVAYRSAYHLGYEGLKGDPKAMGIGRMTARLLGSLLALSLLAAPLAAEAQQAWKGRVIALVFSTSPVSEMVGADPVHPLAQAFVHGLRDLGWVQGRNLMIEARSTEGRPERYPAIFADLVARRVEVIVTSGGESQSIREVQRATRTIPIVFFGPGDPVGDGLVASLARPGGNTTGLTSQPGPELGGKRLWLLKEMVPQITRVAMLGPMLPQQAVRNADARGLTLFLAKVERVDQYSEAFVTVLRERADALYVMSTGLNYIHAPRIAALAAEHRLPAMYAFRESVEAGGLVSYGTDLREPLRRLAWYVDRILKGTQPGEIPIEQPTKFELVINLKIAKALGLTIPRSFLLRADQVIE
jgi:putative ABC transport system substrate-binding protein